MDHVMSAQGISMAFGAARVLHGVSFDLRPGEVHALLGGNGAGKSTLMKIMAGLLVPQSGTVHICNQVLTQSTPAEAQRLGLYLVPQEAQIFPNQDVLENICLGLPHPAAHYRAKVQALIDGLGLTLPLTKRASTLEIADRQLVEVLRGLVREARVLILDEPTSALTPFEVGALFGRMRALRAAGVGMVFISHKLHELRDISDRITVLRDGVVVLSGPMAQLDDDRILQAVSPGLADALTAPTAQTAPGPVQLSLHRLSGEGFADISLDLHAGEVLGMAGVVGAGRTELAESLAGLRPLRSGEAHLNGKALDLPRWTARRAIAGGIALLAEDRGTHGLFLDAPLHWNLSSALVHTLPFVLRPAQERAAFQTWREALSIRCEGPEQLVGRLSGGNQQKVLLAKCLAAKPRVLILDEPTRGVDAGARADIYALIRQIADQGTAILMISSDFDEITRLSHRILVMAAGRIAGELPAGADAGAIGALAFESRTHAHA